MFQMSSRGTVKKEIAWNSVYLYDMLVQNATGGGFSVMNKRPGYQKRVIPAEGFPRKVKSQRGVPDIAAHACIAPDNICFWVYMQGQNWVTGGTSAVAPLWAALAARLNEGLGEDIGFFNPLLYKMESSKALKSINEGNNSMPNSVNEWHASDGWDPCTGLGIPNGTEMLKWLKKNLKRK
jgi:kumamolisin